MKIAQLLTALAATALIGGVACAQSTTTKTKAVPAPSPTASSIDAPTGTAVATSVTTTEPSGATVTSTLVTNGPVPDTRANRARYGQPMSNAGKRTPAKGN